MNEIDPIFCKTLKANKEWVHSNGLQYFKTTNIINADIRDLNPLNVIDKKNIEMIVGGPPCQSFSSSGKQLSVLDPRGTLLKEFYRFIDVLKPKIFLFENVRGLITSRDDIGTPGGVINEMLNILTEIGYSCRAALLNSADFGSYQRRVRCFIIGTKNGLAPLFPEPTHVNSKKGLDSLFGKSWITLRDFLSLHCDNNENNFSYPTPQLLKQLTSIPNGSGLKSPGRAEKTRPGGHWGYRQGTFIADLDSPARTITGSCSQDWVRWDDRLRRLTFNEIKLLQGFPSDWFVAGNKTQQYKQIGNAVPIIFGEILGRTIFNYLKKYPTGEKPITLGMPTQFQGYISYTKKDHEKNHESRVVHKYFI